MDLFLQVWGGGCYLANKILFATAEAQAELNKKQLQTIAWVIYILGVPAWVVILLGEQNWIAASIEAGGIPAMLLGLYNTYYDYSRPNLWFNRLVTFCTYTSLALGMGFSLNAHGGITSVTQVLEIGVMLGFLLGSYYLAKRHSIGWLFFILMNLSMASLMFLQDKPILMAQQLLSLGFVVYGFTKNRTSA